MALNDHCVLAFILRQEKYVAADAAAVLGLVDKANALQPVVDQITAAVVGAEAAIGNDQSYVSPAIGGAYKDGKPFKVTVHIDPA